MKKEIEEKQGECICKTCGFTWDVFKTEHFNFTHCVHCGSNKIGGYYNKK